MLLAKEASEEEKEDALVWRGLESKHLLDGEMVSPLEVGFRQGGTAHAGRFELGDVVLSQSSIPSFLSLLRLLFFSRP